MIDHAGVEVKLRTAREAVFSGGSLRGTGFWGVVSKVRRDRGLAERFGREIAEIDRTAFENSVKLRLPVSVGSAVLVGGTVIGLALVIGAQAGLIDGLLADLAFLAGFGAILVSTHSLVHWFVGRAMGIRFTHYFLGGPPPPRPGLKLDYESYLLVHPRKRAMFHASGAVVTKLLPFVFIPAAISGRRSSWVVWGLVALGIAQVLTDVLFSTKTSDWKKYIREMKAARRAKGWS